MELIAVTGYAGHGKDTVGAILREQYGFLPIAFADPLRAMLGALYAMIGVDLKVMHDRELKELEIPGLGVSYRRMAQTLGTEWARHHLYDDFWIQVIAKRLAHLETEGHNKVVITDLRFINEASWVRSVGGVVWKVSRDGIGKLAPHESEIQIGGIKPNAVLANNGTIDELANRVKILME
jgi:hypothetical protein